MPCFCSQAYPITSGARSFVKAVLSRHSLNIIKPEDARRIHYRGRFRVSCENANKSDEKLTQQVQAGRKTQTKILDSQSQDSVVLQISPTPATLSASRDSSEGDMLMSTKIGSSVPHNERFAISLGLLSLMLGILYFASSLLEINFFGYFQLNTSDAVTALKWSLPLVVSTLVLYQDFVVQKVKFLGDLRSLDQLFVASEFEGMPLWQVLATVAGTVTTKQIFFRSIIQLELSKLLQSTEIHTSSHGGLNVLTDGMLSIPPVSHFLATLLTACIAGFVVCIMLLDGGETTIVIGKSFQSPARQIELAREDYELKSFFAPMREIAEELYLGLLFFMSGNLIVPITVQFFHLLAIVLYNQRILKKEARE